MDGFCSGRDGFSGSGSVVAWGCPAARAGVVEHWTQLIRYSILAQV